MRDDASFGIEPKDGKQRGWRAKAIKATDAAPIVPPVPRVSSPASSPPSRWTPTAPIAPAPQSEPSLADSPPPVPRATPATGLGPLAMWFRRMPIFLAIIALPIFGVIHGAATLKAARRGESVNRAGAMAWLVASGLVIVAAAGGIAYAVLRPGEARAASEVAVGECLLPNGLTDDSPDLVSELRAIDCAEPHYGQVFFRGTLPSGNYPGDSAVRSAVDQACTAQANRVVLGADDPDGYLQYLFPTEETWNAGDQGYTCLVTASGEARFVGSVVAP